jgi:putative hydrolase of the HAD superfamily
MTPRLPAVPRAIFFDAGNTLLRMNYAVIAGQLVTLGIAVTPDAVQRAEWRARVRLDASLAPGASTESRSTGERYLCYLLDGLGVRDEAVVEAAEAWRRTYNPPVGLWNTPEPEAEAALALARARGLRVAVISNSNGSVAGILATLGLARHLDFVLDSHVVGVEKPDPRIFEMALDRAGVRPREAVYVGDLYSIDVLGARRVGMEAILLDPGACWGARDCPAVSGPLAAVRLALGEAPAAGCSPDRFGGRVEGSHNA